MDKSISDNIKIDFLNAENKILSMLWLFIFLIELFVQYGALDGHLDTLCLLKHLKWWTTWHFVKAFRCMVNGLNESRDGLRKHLSFTISQNYSRIKPLISTLFYL